MSILSGYNAEIFAASPLILYCSFSSLFLSAIVMISFYIISKKIFLKHEELSDARVVSITKKTWFCSTLSIKMKVNIWWMMKFYKAYQQSYHQIWSIFSVSYLNCVLQVFYKYCSYYLSIQKMFLNHLNILSIYFFFC